MSTGPIPIGTYDAPRVVDHGVIIAQTKTPGVEVKFAVMLDDGTEGFVRYRGWLSDAALARTVESLGYLGWTGNDIAELNTGALMLVGEGASITVEHDDPDDKGRIWARVGFVNGLGGGRIVRAPANEVQSLSQRIQGGIMRARQQEEENRKARFAGQGQPAAQPAAEPAAAQPATGATPPPQPTSQPTGGNAPAGGKPAGTGKPPRGSPF